MCWTYALLHITDSYEIAQLINNDGLVSVCTNHNIEGMVPLAISEGAIFGVGAFDSYVAAVQSPPVHVGAQTSDGNPPRI